MIGDDANGRLLIHSHGKWRIAWMKWQKEMGYIFFYTGIHNPGKLRKDL